MNICRIFLTTLVLLAPVFVVAQTDTSKTNADSSEVKNNPVFSLSADDLESDAQNQDVSSLLQSSRDVFTSIAGYNFSAARFRMRGYNSEFYKVMMGSVQMNDPETGQAIWAYWGGLNDVTRYPEVQNGISSSQMNFGGLAGFSNINLRASEFRKGSRFSYAVTNRTYRNRMMLTHSSGLLKNGWAFTLSASTRWSKEGYIEGTYFSGASYFASVEKQFNKNHSIGLAGFGAPTVQARQGIALQEVYELTGDNFYNPYWGYQNGGKDKRNARERDNHRPSVFLTHYWQINSKTKLNTTLYGTFGRTGNTNLNWYDAPDPRPDYYRYLPSYYQQTNPAYANQLAEQWANDPSVSQIDWDALYNANYKNLYTLDDADGISGNTQTFNRSKYILEMYRVDPRQIGINTIYKHQLNETIHLSGGLNIDRYMSRNYKILDDLLGGDYWVDVDQFAERDFADPNVAQNDLDNPNQLIAKGDVFGYNYNIHVNKEELFGQTEYKKGKIEAYGALNASHTAFWRDGLWANGRFPDNSKGKSDINNFYNYGVKAGLIYKLSGRHFIIVNSLYQTKAPNSRNAFISPRTRGDVIPGLKNMSILSGDLNYQIRYPKLKVKATVFYSEINNQTWSRSFYHDEFRTFVNYTMTGVNHLHMGTELGVEANITSTFLFQGAFTSGQYLFNSRPKATITRDNSDEIIAENRTIYLKNYKIGGMPQTAASIGIKYNSPKYWFAGVNANLFYDIYLSPNPDRRTEEAVEKYISTDPQWSAILDQTKLDNGYVINAYAGKSWKIKNQYLRAHVSVNNVLNNTTFRSGGYEQLRYDANDIDKFPPKYGYMYGTTYFIMLTYLF